MSHPNPGNRDIRRSMMSSTTGNKSGNNDPHGDERWNQTHDRMMRQATGGLCGFTKDGELVLEVDPEKYAKP